MLAKVRVTVQKTKVMMLRTYYEGYVNEVPCIGRVFKVISKPSISGTRPSINVIASAPIRRILCVYPDKVWIETDKVTYKIEVIRENKNPSAYFFSIFDIFR